MTGIKMSDCRFYVNKEERVVVCVIPRTKQMLENYIFQHFRFTDFDLHFAMNADLLHKIVEMPSSFMGKAVCAEGDEWDEELGRKIAFSRAKDKCYRSFFRRANAYVNALDKRLNDMIESFNTFGDKLAQKKEDLQHQIDLGLDK